MSGAPIAAVNEELPKLRDAVKDDPTIGEIARLGVISFGDTARSELPLSDIQFADIPRLDATGPSTDFGSAFELARPQIEAEIRALGRGSRFHRPVMFFLSDGHHNVSQDWRPKHQQLVDEGWKFRPEIVAFGFGQANEDEIRAVATRHAFFAKDTNPTAAVREILHTVIGSIRVTSRSLRGGDTGGLEVPADPNKFTELPVQTVD
jgi:uncharacterized protein YegL